MSEVWVVFWCRSHIQSDEGLGKRKKVFKLAYGNLQDD